MEHRENYHGLIKQGTTCYLNSVLQVLFMTREFRDAVDRSVENNPNSDFIDPHLKELFDRLLQKPTDTRKILNTLHVDKVLEQQDAAEYLEKILKQTSPNAAKIFQGQMVHRTRCSDCGTETDPGGPFWLLPLELLNENYSVETGIQEFFKTSEFSGEKQMYCGTCTTKVNSTSTYEIKHHPDVLVLLLKKFDYSYCSMSYVKISCDVEVPHNLKIPQDQTYELYAVVDHLGDQRGGHYSATIKDDEDRWFRFDEDRVTPLHHSPFPDNRNVAKYSRAYLLFYRKKDSGLEDSQDKHTNEDDSSTKDAVLQPADKKRSTHVKTKRKGLVKDDFYKHSVTTGESEQKKPKQDKRPTGGNRGEEKTSQKKKKSINNVDLERRERLTGNQAAERGEEMKEIAQTNTNRGLEEAADRRYRSEKSKLKVRKITETKQLVHSDKTNSRPLMIKTVEEESFTIEGKEERNDRNINNESDTNTTKVSLSTSADVDQSESLQPDVSGLKNYQGIKLEVPDQKRSLKKKFWENFQTQFSLKGNLH